MTQRARKFPNPILKLTLDGFEINSRTTSKKAYMQNKDIVNIGFAEYYNHTKPTQMAMVLAYWFPDSKVEIIVSNHKKFDSIKKVSPHAFNLIGTVEYIKYVKEYRSLIYEIGSTAHLELLKTKFPNTYK